MCSAEYTYLLLKIREDKLGHHLPITLKRLVLFTTFLFVMQKYTWSNYGFFIVITEEYLDGELLNPTSGILNIDYPLL